MDVFRYLKGYKIMFVKFANIMLHILRLFALILLRSY